MNLKKNILAIIFVFIGFTMQSQVLIALLLGDKLNTGKIEFGLDGGLNYATIAGMESNTWTRNFNLGFYFDIRMKEQWFLNTGVLVKSNFGLDDLSDADLEFLNATTYDTKGEYRQRISYFMVPALAKYKFDNNMYVEFGPQFGLMYDAYIEFNSEIDGNSARIREKNKDAINRFDMGLSAGVGYRLLKGMGWTLGARYYYGLLDVYKDRSGTNVNSLFLKLNIPIGLSVEKKDQIKGLKAEKKQKKAEKKKAKKDAKQEKKNNSSEELI